MKRNSDGLVAWWCNRVLNTDHPVVWMTTDEYLELRDCVHGGARRHPVNDDNTAGPVLMGRPIVLVDQFDTVAFALRDERSRYIGTTYTLATW